jgi:hypothetical protein
MHSILHVSGQKSKSKEKMIAGYGAQVATEVGMEALG